MKRHLKTKIKMALVGFIEIDPFQARYWRWTNLLLNTGRTIWNHMHVSHRLSMYWPPRKQVCCHFLPKIDNIFSLQLRMTLVKLQLSMMENWFSVLKKGLPVIFLKQTIQKWKGIRRRYRMFHRTTNENGDFITWLHASHKNSKSLLQNMRKLWSTPFWN